MNYFLSKNRLLIILILSTSFSCQAYAGPVSKTKIGTDIEADLIKFERAVESLKKIEGIKAFIVSKNNTVFKEYYAKPYSKDTYFNLKSASKGKPCIKGVLFF